MATRKATSGKRHKDSQQEFLSKPARRRQRPASGDRSGGTRRYRHQQPRPAGLRDASSTAGRIWPRLHGPRVLALVLLAGLAGLVAFLFSDPRFYVETAAIRGLRNVSAETVYEQAGIHQYSIFWLNPQDAARRIEALPHIKQATVHLALPNQVRIEVDEREPVVLWKVNGQEYWVDLEGVAMPVLPVSPEASGQQLRLPVLWDLDGSTVSAEGRPESQLIAALHQVKQKMPEVTDFGYDRSNGLQFRLPAGTLVYLGKPEGMVQRVASLLVLHQSLASQGQLPAEINWRVENGYYLRLAQ